jgi:transposase
MASITFRKTKKPGVYYAYQSESYRNPVTKRVKTRQKYLGIGDPISKEIISTDKTNSNNRSTQKSDESMVKNTILGNINPTIINKSVGPFMLLDNITSRIGILELLKSTFPDIYLHILSFVYFIIHTGDALSNCHIWSRRFLHPSNSTYISQDVTSLLDKITTDQCNIFMQLWLKKFINTEYLCYDITSISSYNQNSSFIKRGYNRDHEKLPQINLALLYGQQSKLPAYYRRIQGNINDVKTLEYTINSLNLFNIKGFRFILDRGFYSENNVTELLDRPGTHFTLAIPIRRKWVEKEIDKSYDTFCIPDNFYKLDNDDHIYALSKLYKWYNSPRRLYLHIYYNEYRAIDDHSNFISDLTSYKEKIENDINNKALRNDYYDAYLIFKENKSKCISIKYNNEAISTHKKRYAGYFCILSTMFKNPIDAIDVYRNKDVIEKSFDDLKNELELSRFRVHTQSRIDSKIFIYFIALIIISEMRKIYKDDNLLKKYSCRNLVQFMEPLEQSKIEGTYKTFYTEADKTQKHIFELFNLTWPA